MFATFYNVEAGASVVTILTVLHFLNIGFYLLFKLAACYSNWSTEIIYTVALKLVYRAEYTICVNVNH